MVFNFHNDVNFPEGIQINKTTTFKWIFCHWWYLKNSQLSSFHHRTCPNAIMDTPTVARKASRSSAKPVTCHGLLTHEIPTGLSGFKSWLVTVYQFIICYQNVHQNVYQGSSWFIMVYDHFDLSFKCTILRVFHEIHHFRQTHVHKTATGYLKSGFM